MKEQHPYADILNETRPVHQGDAFSAKHPPMTIENRSKIFAPFAALKGYEESLESQQIEHLNNQKD